jgi:hypothetical protein
MKKTVFTSFLLMDSNEVISFSLMKYEGRLLCMEFFVRLLAMTVMNYAEFISLTFKGGKCVLF